MKKLLFWTIVIGTLPTILGVMFGIAAGIDTLSCHSRWRGRDASWGPFQGCLVHINQGWMPERNIRAIDP